MALSLSIAAPALATGSTSASSVTTKTYPPPDNTKINQRDSKDAKTAAVTQSGKQPGPTADQQSNAPEALELLRRIRAALTSAQELSTYARNVKIVVESNQAVWLRGPVRSANEKQQVETIARREAGSTAQIHNELELAL